MAHLTLTGVSDDGKRLLLVTDSGEEHTVDLDERLRAALATPPTRGSERRLETTMTSSLRPRDIQARIRAGETPDEVAAAAGTTIDKIMTYAGPVLAERQHVAERAQRSSLRRTGEAAGTARTLGDAIDAHLRSQNVDPASLEWDAWRREDGRWTLTGVFSAVRRSGTAQFTYDAPGNFVVLENDDARWLLGELSEQPATAPPLDDLMQARQRRLAGARPAATRRAASGRRRHRSGPRSRPGARPKMPRPNNTREIPRTPAASADADHDDSGDRDSEHHPGDDEPAARPPVRKARGRASVPSWDEIMFGGKQD